MVLAHDGISLTFRGQGESDRRVFGLFRSNRSCLKTKLLLVVSTVGWIFRTSWVGETFVSTVFAKTIVGNAKAQYRISIIPFFIGTFLK